MLGGGLDPQEIELENECILWSMILLLNCTEYCY